MLPHEHDTQFGVECVKRKMNALEKCSARRKYGRMCLQRRNVFVYIRFSIFHEKRIRVRTRRYTEHILTYLYRK